MRVRTPAREEVMDDELRGTYVPWPLVFHGNVSWGSSSLIGSERGKELLTASTESL